MVDGRYWVTYISKREREDSCESAKLERVTDSASKAAGYAVEFMYSAESYMNADTRVTECVVHVYDADSGTFPIHRTLERVGRCDGLRWFALDE